MLTLPTKFESVLRSDELAFRPLILQVDNDLRSFRSVARFARAQDAGVLAVIESPPGRGKTTAVYAASVLLHRDFEPVLPVPPAISLELRNIPEWLNESLPPKVSSKTIPVLIDGRESTDDSQGLRDVMSALNNLVRGRPDLLFIWPTTDVEWRDRLVNAARSFGSQSFCPDRSVFSIEGPAREQWVDAVSLVLDQLGATWDEFGINESSAQLIAEDFDGTLGDFFTVVNGIRIEQEDLADRLTGLPRVLFVVSSHSQIVGDVARLRNPKTYAIRTDEIIASARQGESGKFWQSRGAQQKSNLAWVASLLKVKLVALTPSTVSHACGMHAPAGSRLADALSPLEFRASRSTGGRALSTTDLARFLAGESVPEVLTKNKGKTSDKTLAAYDAIQLLSAKQHRAINESILKFVGEQTKAFDPSEVRYEVGLGGDAVVDAVVPVESGDLYFEFHHISGTNCSPNKIADYIMKKLRVYAIQYNLIDR